MSGEVTDLLPGLHVPHACTLVLAGGEREPPIGREGSAPHDVRVAAELPQHDSRISVPEPRDVVATDCKNRPPVRRKDPVEDADPVLELANLLAGRHVPDRSVRCTE